MTVRVWNVIVSPLLNVSTGLIRNVLIADVAEPLLKFIAACCAPNGVTSKFDPKTPVVPIGELTLSACQLPDANVSVAPGLAWFGKGATVGRPVSNPSVSPATHGVGVAVGVPVAVAVGVGAVTGVAVGVGVPPNEHV